MTIASIGGEQRYFIGEFSSSVGGANIDADGEKVAQIFPAAIAGDIEKVIVRTQNITSSQAVKVSIQGVNSSGDPDGTILGATSNAFGTIATPAANTSYTVTLGEVATVALDQKIAVVCEFSSTTGNLQISYGTSANTISEQRTYFDQYTTSWTKNTSRLLNVVVIYSGGEYHSYGFTDDAFDSLGSGSTPDEIGNYFLAPVSCRVVGLSVCKGVHTEDGTLKLYASNGSTVLGTGTIEAEFQGGSGWYKAHFSSNVNIVKGTAYYMTYVPGSTAHSIFQIVVSNSAHMAAFPMGTDCYAATRTDGGAWTTTATERWAVTFLFDGIDFPAVGDVQNDATVNGSSGTLTLPTVGQVQSGVTYGAGGTEYTGTLAKNAPRAGSSPLVTS